MRGVLMRGYDEVYRQHEIRIKKEEEYRRQLEEKRAKQIKSGGC